MEIIRSRQNKQVQRLRQLGGSAKYREECGEFLAAGRKLYDEAIAAKLEITALLTAENAAPEILGYIADMQSPPDAVFSAKIPNSYLQPELPKCVVLMENVQDPGNAGTIIRTAGALGYGIAMLGDCADPWSLKVIRGAMGAAFRVPIARITDVRELGLPVIAAVARDGVPANKFVPPGEFAVAIGNEGNGLSESLIAASEYKVTIPMGASSESLNAASAAAILMWQFRNH
ncbi:MAG: RNA methyltransferase [Oscillospiraceae bacterium]|jgi:TrmH family RNA methyltransferase|nr:RNA methyltransferase [Oscillospiraceae bacterium]